MVARQTLTATNTIENRRYRPATPNTLNMDNLLSTNLAGGVSERWRELPKEIFINLSMFLMVRTDLNDESEVEGLGHEDGDGQRGLLSGLGCSKQDDWEGES